MCSILNIFRIFAHVTRFLLLLPWSNSRNGWGRIIRIEHSFPRFLLSSPFLNSIDKNTAEGPLVAGLLLFYVAVYHCSSDPSEIQSHTRPELLPWIYYGRVRGPFTIKSFATRTGPINLAYFAAFLSFGLFPPLVHWMSLTCRLAATIGSFVINK